MRQGVRRLAKGVGAVALGYGGYTAGVQLYAANEISRRAELPDLTEKFAPIRVFGRYVNPFPEYRHQTLFEFGFRRVAELFTFTEPGAVPVDRALLDAALPVYRPDFARRGGNALSVTWIGQSCTFAQLPGGVNVLTDPMFANHVVSPRMGPQRLVPAPCQPAELPQPGVVLVSHDHQDHLDLGAAAQLARPGTTWVVPTGVGKHLPASAQVVEMSWWEKIPLPNVDPALGYEVACTPAMHWSGRALYDSNTTLWCSFLVLRHGRPLFFHAGDSGYSPELYKSIAKVYGPGCDVAVVPCGAYDPRWHLRSQHMAPFESIETMLDLGARKLVGVHWGTFVMSEEPFDEPPKLLAALAHEVERSGDVVAPQLGRTISFDLDKLHTK